MSSTDVEQFVFYQLANAQVRPYPFPHFYVSPVFPDGFYRALRERLPEVSGYQRLDETGTVPKGAYPERFICSLEELEERESVADGGSFWAEMNTWLMGPAFARLVMYKFSESISLRFGESAQVHTSNEARLVRDLTNYAISPHTDVPHKLVSLLFYLPPDERTLDLGTSIYLPKDPTFRCEGKAHHKFELFNKVATMEFRPNSLFGFFKTDRAFHGVDRIAAEGIVRDLLLYNIYVRKVASSEPPRAAAALTTWPWEGAGA